MTIQQMIELIENERDCLQWWSYGDCDMICSNCELKRDNGELYDMYTNVISMLKEQEPVEPTINEYGEAYCICGENVGIIPSSKNLPSVRSKYCSECGRRMKWE